MQSNLPKHGCARPTVCIVKTKDALTWDHIAVRNKMVRNVFLNRQFRNNMFHSELGTRNKTVLIDQFGTERCVPFKDRNLKQNGPNWPIWEQCVPFTDRNSEQNGPNWPIWEQCVSFTDRNSEQNGPSWPIWEQCVPFTDRNSERNVALLHQGERFVPTL